MTNPIILKRGYYNRSDLPFTDFLADAIKRFECRHQYKPTRMELHPDNKAQMDGAEFEGIEIVYSHKPQKGDVFLEVRV